MLKKLKVNLCIWTLTANNDENTKHLYSSRAFWKIKRNFRKLGTLKEPKEALSNIKDKDWTREYNEMFDIYIMAQNKT